ncbi:hypothetical protein SCP_1402920 [Sparassis crispa]|uniref:Uncharacterized protein n=1 Tax=Sparassis crispa TaxID=139825 RepID=A0A401H397_9APHY|nr:hypothetical protein SCP_1402920 [Sparassis crispa]GBE88884.1 hypothetical protein SCP_1402920 [Sparassis crispa]
MKYGTIQDKEEVEEKTLSEKLGAEKIRRTLVSPPELVQSTGGYLFRRPRKGLRQDRRAQSLARPYLGTYLHIYLPTATTEVMRPRVENAREGRDMQNGRRVYREHCVSKIVIPCMASEGAFLVFYVTLSLSGLRQ